MAIPLSFTTSVHINFGRKSFVSRGGWLQCYQHDDFEVKSCAHKCRNADEILPKKFEVKTRAFELQIRAYEVKSCLDFRHAYSFS